MTSKKQVKKTKDSVSRAILGMEDVALGGATALVATGIGAGLAGAARLAA